MRCVICDSKAWYIIEEMSLCEKHLDEFLKDDEVWDSYKIRGMRYGGAGKDAERTKRDNIRGKAEEDK